MLGLQRVEVAAGDVSDLELPADDFMTCVVGHVIAAETATFSGRGRFRQVVSGHD